MSGSRFIVYGDFNCPFCYALQQRLHGLDGPRAFEWKMVEHDADLPLTFEEVTDAQQVLLRTEMDAIRVRAPDVDVRVPAFRPNSRRAIEVFAEVAARDADAADDLRRTIFVAIWRRGLNVGDDAVLAQVAAKMGVALPPVDAYGTEQRERWYREWSDGGYDRIPTMLSPAGGSLLGLTTPEQLDLFLRGGIFGSGSADVCPVPRRDTTDPTAS